MPPTIYVRAPARLHLGFIDLHGGLGRRFGSIGLAITGFDAEVSAQRTTSGVLEVSGKALVWAREAAAQTRDWLAVQAGLRIAVSAVAPSHAGLGSGTQLALAVAQAVASACEHPCDARELAPVVGRGKRSGIGIAAFAHGGLLVDGGRGQSSLLAPLLVRLEFPPAWRIVLVFDHAHQGLNGVAERTAFANLPPMSEQAAGALARWCLVGLLPALAEGDFAAFSRAVAEIQARVGAYFAAAQGGAAYTSEGVATAVAEIGREFTLQGIGQSSWGPTAFIFAPDDACAEAIRDFGEARHQALHFQIVAGCNHGAVIEPRKGS